MRAGKTFRLYVSSTFSDLKEERNALQRHVFPRLRELSMAHGCRFQAIDLRWGVSEEAALDHQTLRLCLREIERCQKVTPRPNFLILLGERYGWRPLPEAIPAGEFEAIERSSPEPQDRALLHAWYRRDDNAVPPVYLLQRRTGVYTDSRVYAEEVEGPLHRLFVQASAGLGLTREERLRYTGSATEQEIVHGALAPPAGLPDVRGHVFGFFRQIANLGDLLDDLGRNPLAREFLDPDEEGRSRSLLDGRACTSEKPPYRMPKLRDREPMWRPSEEHKLSTANEANEGSVIFHPWCA